MPTWNVVLTHVPLRWNPALKYYFRVEADTLDEAVAKVKAHPDNASAVWLPGSEVQAADNGPGDARLRELHGKPFTLR